MSDVRLQRNLKTPPVPAFSALLEILSGIESQTGPWQNFSLHVSLGDVHLPDVGYLNVPIALKAGAPARETREVPIEFDAAKHAGSFPHFKGAAGVDAMGPTGSILWISGGYDVPLQLFGRLLDATLTAGVAERTLENLIDDLAEAVVANVDQREAEYVRYRRF